jgi:tRNA dimethylallyltransferase
MHERLAARDPGAAAAILPTNGRRIVRALEVGELTGQPFAARLADRPAKPVISAVRIGLTVPRPELDARITARVDAMFDAPGGGLMAEVRALAKQGLRAGPTAARALGYRQVLQLFDGELPDEAAARAATVRATRTFARRQATWFGNDTRVTWLPYDAPDLLDQALAAVDAGPR